MFNSIVLIAESSALVKKNKIEINVEQAYAVLTLNEIFSYKNNQNKDLSNYAFIFKNENDTSKFFWMKRSQETTDIKTWE